MIVRTLKKFGSLVAGVVGRMFHFVFGDDELDAYLQNSLVVMLRGIAKLRKERLNIEKSLNDSTKEQQAMILRLTEMESIVIKKTREYNREFKVIDEAELEKEISRIFMPDKTVK